MTKHEQDPVAGVWCSIVALFTRGASLDTNVNDFYLPQNQQRAKKHFFSTLTDPCKNFKLENKAQVFWTCVVILVFTLLFPLALPIVSLELGDVTGLRNYPKI